jgi:hypothetical protein
MTRCDSLVDEAPVLPTKQHYGLRFSAFYGRHDNDQRAVECDDRLGNTKVSVSNERPKPRCLGTDRVRPRALLAD